MLVVTFWNWLFISVSCASELVLAREGLWLWCSCSCSPGCSWLSLLPGHCWLLVSSSLHTPKASALRAAPQPLLLQELFLPGRRGFHLSFLCFMRLLSPLSFSLPRFPGMAAPLPSISMAPTVLEWAANLMAVSSAASSGSVMNWVTFNRKRSRDRHLHLTSLLPEHNPLTQPSEPSQTVNFVPA